jgi:23S rRNA (cytosine1962-C5)-methyltransferase
MSEPTVEIGRRGLGRLERGHLWIYRSDVVRTEGVSPGEIVRVVDGRGWFVGRAFYSHESQITLRMLTREDEAVDEGFFARRLDAALAMRKRLFGDADAVRLVHGESDLLPGFVVDRYADVLSIQTLVQGTDRRQGMLTDLLQERLGPRAIVERNDAKVRSYEGLALRSGVVRGEAPGRVTVREGEIVLEIDPVGGQKTGGFLDQRENHLMTGALVRPGDRCLDAFSYGGGFALQMARAGGAVTAVEISEKAVAEAQVAAKKNDLAVELVTANAFDWLKAASVDGRHFEVVVLDPPAFARSKGAIEGALRGYKEINLRAIQLLSPGGWLVSCSCSYHVDEETLLGLIASAASDAGRRLQLVERRGAGRDHPALLGVPETAYLKCLVLRRVA